MSTPTLRKAAAVFLLVACSSSLKAQAPPKASAKLDLNKATAAEMIEALPGVGEATAAKIVAGRPYKTVDELETKAGVPKRTVDGLRDRVALPAAEPAKAKDAPKAKDEPKPAGTKVDLNKATAAQLQELPGVGEATAALIVAGRPYKTVDELEKVKGFGPARIAAVRDFATVGGPPTPTPATPADAPKAKAKAEAPKAKAAPLAGPVNLNTATRAQIEALPFIGPVKAQAIIDARPYKKKEDIMKVLGIKEGVFDRIKDSIRVD